MDDCNRPDAALSREETLLLRQNYIAGACQLHFDQNPVKIVGSSEQYLFDDTGEKYLDCASRITNVGHCHPHILEAARRQMETLSTGMEEVEGDVQLRYSKELLATLPPSFEVCLFTTSGSEANDLALRLARLHTRRRGVVVVENAFHGAVDSLIDISPKAFKKLPSGKKPWVYVVPLPDMYRGRHAGENDAAEKYFQAAKLVIDRGRCNSGEIGCFISEPIFLVQGMVLPPAGWLRKIYSYIHEMGGVVIADEIQTGMGRSATHFWAFETQDVVPDIITVGKPMGNGYPIAAVITSRKIASAALGYQNQFMCGPVAAAIGSSVLQVIREEKSLNHATCMSQLLVKRMLEVKKKHRHVGDVRSVGMMVGLDIVWCTESKKPAPELAERISYRMKDERVIVASEGEYSNVLLFIPPLCISPENVEQLGQAMEKVLSQLEIEDSEDIYRVLASSSPQPSSSHAGFMYSFKPSVLENANHTFSDSDDSNPAPDYDSMD